LDWRQRISGLQQRGLARQLVAAVVVFVGGVPLDPDPFHLMFAELGV
jgi:hypothetical protein